MAMRFKDTLSAPPPREASAEHLPTTPALKSTITRIGEYGLFVHTENETDGLVHHTRGRYPRIRTSRRHYDGSLHRSITLR